MQITKHIHAIKIPFHVKIGSDKLERFVYSYLICGEKICLIDSGVSSSDDLIFDYMDKLGLKENDLSLMILTHSHPDHMGSAKSIKDKSDCKVLAHENEIKWIENIELQAKERPVPNFHSLVEGSVPVDGILENGDMVDLGDNITMRVIHTPGHSEGSISLFTKGEGVLFTGDAILIPGELPIYDDYNQLIESIKKMKDIKGVNTLLAAWDDPRKGNEVYRIMDDSLDYLKHINEIVKKVDDMDLDLDPIEFSKRVLKEINIPEMAANPIIARSFQSNLDY
jgi:glyoxylase-like metal-dependent hydrolase (beta-lactamase superfamily II)